LKEALVRKYKVDSRRFKDYGRGLLGPFLGEWSNFGEKSHNLIERKKKIEGVKCVT